MFGLLVLAGHNAMLFMTLLPLELVYDYTKRVQIKRSAKAALYRREIAQGNLVAFEVFPVRSKDGAEIYPDSKAYGVWAWCTQSLDRAESCFSYIESGEFVIPTGCP
jgi:hypothetical protein